VRPWYKSTINTKEVVISEPYITKVTNEMIVSVTKTFKSKNNIQGVIGMSVKLNDLMDSVNNLKIGDTGYIIALNSSDKILVSPKHSDWILKTPEELNLNEINYLNIENGNFFEAEFDGSKKVFNMYVSPYSDWKYVAVVDKSEILNQSTGMLNILFFLYFLVLMIIFLIIIFISKYITEPILDISNEIDKMANFKFDFHKNKKFEKYILQSDEIGTISKSIDKMYNNFFELNESIKKMNEGIINIDVEKKSEYKLILSKESPFSYVSISINNLLERIQNYFEQIIDSNREIIKKNELLKATEEELIAQIKEIETQKEYINYLAYHDELTDLPNRRRLMEKLEYVLLKKYEGIVILLDLDNFKTINDTLGHIFGDTVLKEFSKRLKNISIKDAFMSRFGGDEFLILASCSDIDETKDFITQLHQVLDEKFIIDKNEVEIKFSMGVTFFPNDSDNIEELIMNSDLALYSVKDRNKNDYAIFNNDMRKKLKKTTNIESILFEAIENDGFKMVYQPQVNLIDGEIDGFEALLRLKNHEISPAEFIPIAEENGMIIKIGRIVTKNVIKQIGIWKEKGYPIKPVAINFSALQMNDIEYFDFIIETLKIYNVESHFIEIEITENVFLDNTELALVFINKLRSVNIKVAIDDFGTGYSSLSYLTILPVDRVKFDRSLNIELLKMETTEVIDSLISVAHSLNLNVVAEGIEEYKQVKKLKIGKCDVIQGYYFSKPLDVDDVEKNIYNNYNNLINMSV
jgi:diguanylate cyclase (GGDEF)-like protein